MNNNRLATAFQEIKPSPMVQMFDIAAKYEDIINLGIGEPDFNTNEKIIDAAFKSAREGFTHYTPVTGFPDLKQEISRYWNNKYGLKVKPQEIMVTCGSVQAIYLCLKALIDPGDEVIVPDPCFTAYLDQIRYLGGKAVGVAVKEENEFKLAAKDIEKHITGKTKVIILNSPSNPTGSVLNESEIEKIAKLIETYDLMVISDEVYEAIVFDTVHVPFVTVPGMRDRTFTVGGFSKTFAMTGWRIGYVFGPEQYIDAIRLINTVITYCSNSLAQKAAVYALQNCEQNVREMVEVYKQRVYYSTERLNSISDISCVRPKGSFYLFANIKNTGLSSMEFSLKMISEARVVVLPGITFGANGEGFIRIACTVPIEQLELAYSRIEKALKNDL